MSETQGVNPFISPRSSQDSSLIARIAFLEKRVDEMEKKSSLALQVNGSDLSTILKFYENIMPLEIFICSHHNRQLQGNKRS